MEQMFYNAAAFNHNISSWTGDAATRPQDDMFSGATKFQAKFECDDAVTGPASSCVTIKSTWVAPSPPPPPSPPPSPPLLPPPTVSASPDASTTTLTFAYATFVLLVLVNFG